eukprot:644625-Amphidinium_carterae.1
MFAKVGSPDSSERDRVLYNYCTAHRSLSASSPMQSRELLEATLQEGCFASSDEFTKVTLLLLGAAHKALGSTEKMRELYKTAFAKCKWETSSMSIDESSTARARDIFTTRRCVDAEDVGQAIPCQGEEL